jgi:uncharacterized cupredoxin-like copper-binding protein
MIIHEHDTKTYPGAALLPRALRLATAIAAGVLALGGSAFAASAAETVKVTLGSPGEYSVKPSVSSIAPGTVTFRVTNHGKLTHELNVIRVSSTAAILPKGKSAGQRLENGKIGAVEGLRPGMSGSVTVALQAGAYQLFCNIPGHYMRGMRTVITVK